MANSDINWLEPRDLDTATMSFQIDDDSRAGISSPHPEGAAAALANFRVCSLTPQHADAETIKASTTIAGGEPLDLSQLTGVMKRN